MERSQHIPPAWRSYAEAARDEGMRLTRSILGPGRSGSRLDDLARRLHQELDRMIEQAFDGLPGARPACSAGCDHCCRTLRVTVTPVEVFAIAHRLRGSDALGAIPRERLVGSTSPSATQGEEPRSGAAGAPDRTMAVPCPLLADGLCVVYSTRPLACRGCVSADASLCAACDDARPVPRSMAHQVGAAAMAAGVTLALKELGLAGTPVEIRRGMALVLSDDDAAKRWLRGEDVFA